MGWTVISWTISKNSFYECFNFKKYRLKNTNLSSFQLQVNFTFKVSMNQKASGILLVVQRVKTHALLGVWVY